MRARSRWDPWPEDASLPNLLRGLVEALRLRLPNLRHQLFDPLERGVIDQPATTAA